MDEEPASGLAAELEEISRNAWPALRQTERDGWLLRQAYGHTKRANSVHTLFPGSTPLVEMIAWAETAYARAGLASIFRLTPLSPEELEDELIARGYDVVEPSLVKVTDMQSAWKRVPEVTLSDLDDAAWLSAFAQAGGLTSVQQTILRAMLGAIVPNARLARVEEHGEAVAFGMAVAERGYVSFYDMLTRSDHRRCGHGRKIMESLMAWGREEGAVRGALQVVEANAPARALYASFGFRTVYGYRYRVLRPT
ncbi:MAG: GNAT family N-acetyltransferase [Pseudomonadota bacterium]